MNVPSPVGRISYPPLCFSAAKEADKKSALRSATDKSFLLPARRAPPFFKKEGLPS
jgi:hypothetical protein